MDNTSILSARLTPVNLNISSDILQRLQKEFGNALRIYQNYIQQLKLDPENLKLRQSLVESQKQIVAVSVKQKLFVKQFREKSQVTPNESLPENKVALSKPIGARMRTGSNEASDRGSNSHCTPPNSEDDHSDLSRSLSCGSGISICTETLSCPSSVSNTPLSSRPNSPNTSNSLCNPPVFPSDLMEQEEFLRGFGLITHESLKTKSETKRVERRRRTTANPKYNGHGFVDLSHISKRTRRLEEPDCDGKSPKRMTLISGVICKHSQPKCIICEHVGCNLTCENCKSQLHVDCIRVSGSRAPAPTRLYKCPRCIVAMHESRRLLGSNSFTDNLKFKKPLIPSTPIIPLNMKKKALGSSSPDLQSVTSETKSSTKTSKVTKKMIAAGIPVKFKPAPSKTTGSLAKTVMSGKASVAQRGITGVKVAAVTESSPSLCKIDLIGKPVLTSPFKTLSALTKGAGTNATKNLQANLGGSSFSNPNVGTIVNGHQPLQHMKPIKKKSKINGIKAKTLSMTGNQSISPNSTPKTLKPKTSPLNNSNSNGNINSPKKKLSIKSSSRLPKFNADQHLSVQRTILAMTAAAKSVMSSNGLRVLPVSLGAELKINGSEQDQTQNATKKVNSHVCSPPSLTPSIPVFVTNTIPNDAPCSPRMNSLSNSNLNVNSFPLPSP